MLSLTKHEAGTEYELHDYDGISAPPFRWIV